MAKDGDRHQLGDPISRIADNDSGIQSALTDTTDPARLTDEELRRQRVNLHEIIRESPLRGTPPAISDRAKHRLDELNTEHRRRMAASSQ